uniref:Uncharacterized protein n=1 Tax=Zea mays TaxID=4577 RepID=A0A804M772_MAIZE
MGGAGGWICDGRHGRPSPLSSRRSHDSQRQRVTARGLRPPGASRGARLRHSPRPRCRSRLRRGCQRQRVGVRTRGRSSAVGRAWCSDLRRTARATGSVRLRRSDAGQGRRVGCQICYVAEGQARADPLAVLSASSAAVPDSGSNY